MWRLLAPTLLLAGCNALFGIHDIEPDASQDPCTGVCECRVDSDCSGAHAVCFDQVTSRTCTCAAGYTAGDTDCTWTGVIVDPGFNQMPSPWMASTMAMLDPTAVQTGGMKDPGVVALTTADFNCDVNGIVSQTLAMPRRSRAEPLQIQVTSTSMGKHGGGGQGGADPVAAIGSGWYDHQFSSPPFGYTTSTLCLGAAHFAPESSTGPGVQLPLVVTMTASQIDRCDPLLTELDVDHLEIVPATNPDTCPDPGVVPNGDAEGTGGWTFQTGGSTGATAAIAKNVGSNGSAGVRLFDAQRCDSARANVQVSVPAADATGAPALSVYHQGTHLSVVIDQTTLPLSGNGQATVDRYCLPAPLRGLVLPFQAVLYVGGSGTCTDVVNSQAIIDNVSVANDPMCGTDPYVTDPGFESGTLPLVVSATAGKSTAAVVADPNAHGGQHDLALTVSDACTNAFYVTQVAAPPVTAGEGAAVSFYYRLAAGTSSFFVSGTTNFAPTRDGQWHQAFACIDPRFPGRSQQFLVELSTSGTTCGAIADETVSIDDLAVVSTTMCPAM
jgi:hypothetical protein